MKSLTAVLTGILAAVLVVGLGIAAWQLGWFVEAKNVDRQVKIDNRNVGTQTAWRDEARRTVASYAVVDPDNTAASGALRNQACGLIQRLRPDYLDADLSAFAAKEC